MKLHIINDKQCITSVLEKPLKITELKKALSLNFSNLFPKDFKLMDGSQILPDSHVLNLSGEEITLYTLQAEPKKKQSQQNPMDELIQQATNAKNKIKPKHKNAPGSLIDRVSILEQMMNSTVSTLNNPNIGNRQAQLSEIQNLLRTLMERPDDIIQHQPPAQVVPDETLVNSLKDMGFPEDRCRQALIRTRNNINRATDLLLNDELDLVQDK
jgi:hypothetical protein